MKELNALWPPSSKNEVNSDGGGGSSSTCPPLKTKQNKTPHKLLKILTLNAENLYDLGVSLDKRHSDLGLGGFLCLKWMSNWPPVLTIWLSLNNPPSVSDHCRLTTSNLRRSGLLSDCAVSAKIQTTKSTQFEWTTTDRVGWEGRGRKKGGWEIDREREREKLVTHKWHKESLPEFPHQFINKTLSLDQRQRRSIKL